MPLCFEDGDRIGEHPQSLPADRNRRLAAIFAETGGDESPAGRLLRARGALADDLAAIARGSHLGRRRAVANSGRRWNITATLSSGEMRKHLRPHRRLLPS